MNNFNEFIIEDITVKKELLGTMPLNNKTNIKKYNEKIENIQAKYKIYKKSLLAYIVDVDNKIEVIEEENKIETLKEKISILETGLKYFDPLMSVYEKCGFGGLQYNIKYFNDFNFDSMNKIIDAYIKTFENAGVKLKPDHFNTTCYSKEYMTAFINNRNINGRDDYDSLKDLFEKLYWKNPDIINQISDDFNINIDKHKDYFEDYIENKKKEFTASFKFKSYDECAITLEKAYLKLYDEQKEKIYDILALARSGEIEINNYKDDAKLKNDVLQELIIGYESVKDSDNMDTIFTDFSLLERNIQEYIDYNNVLPLIENFKKNYEEQHKTDVVVEEPKEDDKKEKKKDKKKEKPSKKDKAKDKAFEDLIDELDSINKIIENGKKGFKKLNEHQLEDYKTKSIELAKELREERSKIKSLEIKEQIDAMLVKKPITIEAIMKVLFRFDTMKRELIRQTFNPEVGIEEMVRHYKEFDSFALNPTHYVVNNISAFDECNVNSIIVNNYRIKGINITEENLKPEMLEELLAKIKMIIRLNTISKSDITADDLWFKLQVEKILDKEKKATEKQN